jgi:UDP-N-acetylmuramate--alanine ligase
MNYHLIGIGGIGMSSLASILLEKKEKVTGSDLNPSTITEALEQKGAKIFYPQKEENVQTDTIVVVSTDIKEDNPELVQAKRLSLPILHRSDLLKNLMENKKPLLVAGTHGKTTTSALLSHVLKESKYYPSFSIGGIVESLKTHGSHNKGEYFVAEADESDGSFLKLPSFGAIVTNVEEDHLNYWKTYSAIQEGFKIFLSQVQSKEHLLWCYDDLILRSQAKEGSSYGLTGGDYQAENIRKTMTGMLFDIRAKGKVYKDIELPLMGQHNVLNATAVFAMSLQIGIKHFKIRKAFSTFKGVKRRQEKIFEHHNISFFDDYAHHPTEISKTLEAFKEHYEERRLVCIFQPHRYTRTKDLLKQFGSCFQEADLVMITDIYAAREKEENVTIQDFVQEVKKHHKNVLYIPQQNLIEQVSEQLRAHDVVLGLGAGDITKKIREIASFSENNFKKWKVAVLYGGKSTEYEVSLVSGSYVKSILDPAIYDVEVIQVSKEGFWFLNDQKPADQIIPSEVLDKLQKQDILFPVFHGPCGEDGMMAAFFALLNKPFAGCDFASAAVAMHKGLTKRIAETHKILVTPYYEISSFHWKNHSIEILEEIEKKLGSSLFIKPVHLGSSIGAKSAENKEELIQAIEYALSFDDVILVEKRLHGREIEVAVIGNDYVKAATPGEILTGGEFYDYDQKYKGGMQAKVPANLSEKQMKKVQELAIKAYQAVGCKGLSRVDFFLVQDDNKEQFILNEINPIPGFTPISLFPKMWYHTGFTEKQLVDQLIISALHHHRTDKIWATN